MWSRNPCNWRCRPKPGSDRHNERFITRCKQQYWSIMECFQSSTLRGKRFLDLIGVVRDSNARQQWLLRPAFFRG